MLSKYNKLVTRITETSFKRVERNLNYLATEVDYLKTSIIP